MAKAVEAILTAFRVKPFHDAAIIDVSYELKNIVPDYIDCVIVATAVVSKEDLATEDSLILAQTKALRKEHGIKVMSFRGLVNR